MESISPKLKANIKVLVNEVLSCLKLEHLHLYMPLRRFAQKYPVKEAYHKKCQAADMHV